MIKFIRKKVLPGVILLVASGLLAISIAFVKLPQENARGIKALNTRVDSLAWRDADTRQDMDSVLRKVQRIELKAVETNTMVKVIYELEVKK